VHGATSAGKNEDQATRQQAIDGLESRGDVCEETPDQRRGDRRWNTDGRARVDHPSRIATATTRGEDCRDGSEHQ